MIDPIKVYIRVDESGIPYVAGWAGITAEIEPFVNESVAIVDRTKRTKQGHGSEGEIITEQYNVPSQATNNPISAERLAEIIRSKK